MQFNDVRRTIKKDVSKKCDEEEEERRKSGVDTNQLSLLLNEVCNSETIVDLLAFCLIFSQTFRRWRQRRRWKIHREKVAREVNYSEITN
jgi:hypothetical protein